MAKISFAQKIKNLFSLHKDRNEDFFDDLLDALIEGDTGAKTSMEIVDILSKKCREEKITDESEIMVTLKKILTEYVKGINIVPEKDKTNVWMVLGVNGVGKTTTCAKMANLLILLSNPCRAALRQSRESRQETLWSLSRFRG